MITALFALAAERERRNHIYHQRIKRNNMSDFRQVGFIHLHI